MKLFKVHKDIEIDKRFGNVRISTFKYLKPIENSDKREHYTEVSCWYDNDCENCPTCSICWNCNIPPRNCWYISDALKKLADYEDLEKQGGLVKLPCKDVYFIVDINNPKYAMVMKKPIRELTIYEIESIDKENCKYFSTEEKAKVKLKELRGGKK